MKTFDDDDDVNHKDGDQGADQDHERNCKAKRQAKGYEYYELFPQSEHFISWMDGIFSRAPPDASTRSHLLSRFSSGTSKTTSLLCVFV